MRLLLLLKNTSLNCSCSRADADDRGDSTLAMTRTSLLLPVALFALTAPVSSYSTSFNDAWRKFRRSQFVLGQESVAYIEERITRDEGSRGIGDVAPAVRGDLLKAAEHLARLPENSTVVILSGFPCCVEFSPPTETDGPSGAFAVARSCVALGLNALILTDACNEEVFVSGAAKAGPWAAACNGKLRIEAFPPEKEWGEGEAGRLQDISKRAGHIVCIERPGRAKDGSCYTMRAISMDRYLAPLDRLIELSKAANPDLAVTAIGDGGNELGFGKVYEETIKSKNILIPDKCVSVVPCDNLIVCSVSNWGGFGLAAAAAMIKYEDGWNLDARAVVKKCLPSAEDEARILAACVEAGCRDGVSREMAETVDGMPLEASLSCLRDIATICEAVRREMRSDYGK